MRMMRLPAPPSCACDTAANAPAKAAMPPKLNNSRRSMVFSRCRFYHGRSHTLARDWGWRSRMLARDWGALAYARAGLGGRSRMLARDWGWQALRLGYNLRRQASALFDVQCQLRIDAR